MHKEYEALRSGSLLSLHGSEGVLAHARFTPDQRIVVIFNNNEEEKELSINVWQAGVRSGQEMTRVFMTDTEGYSVRRETVTVQSGMIRLTMGPLSSAVYVG